VPKPSVDNPAFGYTMPRGWNMSKLMEKKEIVLDVAVQQSGFPKVLYFNRFRVESDDGFKLLQFGLVVASETVDSYSCVLTDEVLLQHQPILLEYIKKLGADMDGYLPWKGASSRKADVADVVSMASRGEIAETIFSVFSMCAATNMANSLHAGTTLPSQPLALLRSAKALQKELITALYGE